MFTNTGCKSIIKGYLQTNNIHKMHFEKGLKQIIILPFINTSKVVKGKGYIKGNQEKG